VVVLVLDVGLFVPCGRSLGAENSVMWTSPQERGVFTFGLSSSSSTHEVFNGGEGGLSALTLKSDQDYAYDYNVPPPGTTYWIRVSYTDGTSFPTLSWNFSRVPLTSNSSFATRSIASPVRLSTAAISGNRIILRFTGALDSSAAHDVSLYTLLVHGSVETMESASYDANTFTVILTAQGSLQRGDTVQISWRSVKDSQGRMLSGQTNLTVH
jgi:hypothetical protein